MILYRVRNWSDHYENNRSRELKKLDWFALPNKQDGDGYTHLVSMPNGEALFGAWVACLQIASRCDPRGTLLRDGGKPHDSDSLSRMSRFSVKTITAMLEACSSSDVNWFEKVTYENPADGCEIPAGGCGSSTAGGCLEGKGREGKEGNGIGEGVAGATNGVPYDAILAGWNQYGPIRCMVISDKRRQHLQRRWKDEFWRNNWEGALMLIGTSEFLNGKNDRNWKASFDWFIQPDSVAKTMEGKYDNREIEKPKKRPGPYMP